MSVVRIPNMTDLGRYVKPGLDSCNVNHLAPVLSHGSSAVILSMYIHVHSTLSQWVMHSKESSQLNDLNTEHRNNWLPFTTNDEVSTEKNKKSSREGNNKKEPRLTKHSLGDIFCQLLESSYVDSYSFCSFVKQIKGSNFDYIEPKLDHYSLFNPWNIYLVLKNYDLQFKSLACT